MTEIWRTVEWYPNYEVSDLGRVRRRIGGQGAVAGRMATLRDSAGGYLRVLLYRGVKKSGVLVAVHRIVAHAFVGPAPSARHECNHKDGNKKNNTPSNLEWVTRSENVKHAFRIGLKKCRDLRGPLHYNAKLDYEKVAQMRAMAATHTSREIAERFGVTHGCVYLVLKRKRWNYPDQAEDREIKPQSRFVAECVCA